MSYVDERDKAAKDCCPNYSGADVKPFFKVGHDRGAFQSEVVKGLVEVLRNFSRAGYKSIDAAAALEAYAQAKKEAGVE